MTKTDYEETADAVASTEMPGEVRLNLVDALCHSYETRNPKFKRQAFRFLCGVYRDNKKD